MNAPDYPIQINVCAGTLCIARGARDLKTALDKELRERHLDAKVQVVMADCNGLCSRGPVVGVHPVGVYYGGLESGHVALLVDEQIVRGRVCEELRLPDALPADGVPLMRDTGFFGRQRLIVLRNRGLIDAEEIDEYIAREGYWALAKVLREMTPDMVIEEVTRSGLRGRGGAGFPTGSKWRACRSSETSPKYIVCNGDEGDPGAFMDRAVMEGDPHSVLEGMAIAAYAVGADQGYLYVRAEYPLAITRLSRAIDQARAYGLLGSDILGKGFTFDVEIYPGAGAFVCGEETALLKSMEGLRGMPRHRPPFPVHRGLCGCPTVINNVETFANINPIVLNGWEWFSSIGTEQSKGTKVFSLTGAVKNVGLVEVPMGTSLHRLVFEIGGGINHRRRLKAVQIGGPSGGCIPAHLDNVLIDYESLKGAGAMMGSGGMVVMDEMTCMVDTARFFTTFLVEESCGRCVACREGLKVMQGKLTDIVEGRGREGDVEFLQSLARHISTVSFCGLGKTAGNPVLSTIRYFRDEYEAHIREKRCPALFCADLVDFEVVEEKCTRCGLCQRKCPSGAILWEKKQTAHIQKDKCVKCRSCIAACRFGAIK
ncbi:MAG: NADH-quinone oxidoreductase subunit NuoF [Thermodesulfobacteriota bacterium]